MPAKDISVTGIPIHPVFSQEKDCRACRQRLGLGSDRPVIVQMAGGFGMGPVEKIFAGVLSVERPLEVVVVAGRNEQLKSRLEQVEVPARHRATVLGFTREIDELMAAADIVLSKPGGLTTSEVLARGAALMIANPVPGQETRNSDFVLENGAGVKVNNLPTLAYKLSRLLDAAGPLAADEGQCPAARPAASGLRRRPRGAGLYVTNFRSHIVRDGVDPFLEPARVLLKPRKARPFFGRHPWVLDSAIDRIEGSPADGDVVDLCSDQRAVHRPRDLQ